MAQELPQTTDVLVIGGGIAGMAIALELRARGSQVTIVDRARLGSGSTSRNAGGIRHQFYQDANIEAAKASIEWVRRIQDDGVDVGLRQVGYLLMYATQAQGARLAEGVAKQNAHGVATRMIGVDEIAEIAPDVRADGMLGACFGPDDGYFDPPSLAEALRARTVAAGVQVVEDAAVVSMRVESGRVSAVETSRGVVAPGVVINAAGAWAGAIAAMHGSSLPIVPRRSQIFVMENVPPLADGMPHTFDTEARFYVRRHGADIWSGAAFKPILDEAPPSQGLEPDWTEAELLAERVGGRVPALAGRRFDRAWAGVIEVTPDDNPVIGWSTPENVYVAAGFSGHGMCVGIGLAASVAAEVLGDVVPIPLDDFRIARFAAEGHAGGEGLWLQERPSRFEQWAQAGSSLPVAGAGR